MKTTIDPVINIANLKTAGDASRQTRLLSKACWIQAPDVDYGPEDAGYYDDHPNTILHKTFALDCVPKQARLLISVKGLYVCKINGRNITDHVLNGSWTNFSRLVYYDQYDVSRLLQSGENTIEIELGNGFWNPSPLRFFGKYNLRERLAAVGDPCALVALIDENNDVLLQSDAQWSWKEGNRLFNNVYLGEKIDCSFGDGLQRPVKTFQDVCNLQPAVAPAIIKEKRVTPVTIVPCEEGLLVDFGEIITGFGGGLFDGVAGQQVEIVYAESIRDGKIDLFGNANGSVGEIMPDGNQVYGGPGAPEKAFEIDTLLLQAGPNRWENQFTWHSFRFMILKGIEQKQIQDIYAWYVHTGLEQSGWVQTDHPVYEALWDAALRTKKNNMHFSFEDCARERLGYGGDMVTLADSNLYTFDVHDFYRKILIDFRLDQTDAGGIPETAPYMGIQSQGTGAGEGPLLWQYVYPYLTWKLIQFYGDIEFARGEYPYLKKQMDYLLSWNPDELARHCLGDHGSVLIAGSFYTPTPAKEFSGYCAQLLFLETFMDIAGAIGKSEEDLRTYRESYERIRKLTIEKFLDQEGNVADNSQTALAFAAKLKLDDPFVLTNRLAIQIEEEGMMTSGIFGMKFTYDLLHAYGYDKTVEDWLMADQEISFRHMLADGNKAFAELFKGEHYSGNHAMFTSFVTWYYQALGGITLNESGNGISIQPFFSPLVNQASARMMSRHGLVTSSWKRENSQIVMEMDLPENLEVEEIRIPQSCTLTLRRNGETATFRKNKGKVIPVSGILSRSSASSETASM